MASSSAAAFPNLVSLAAFQNPNSNPRFRFCLSTNRIPALMNVNNTRPTPIRAASDSHSQGLHQTFDGQEENQPHDDDNLEVEVVEELSPMQALIRSYREAVINGDEEGISDTLATICSIENERDMLLKKVEEIKSDIASGKDQFLQLNVAFNSYRKCSEKDDLSSTSDIKAEVINSFLPVVHGFENTKQQLKLETEKEKQIDRSYQGIYKQLVEIIRASSSGVGGAVEEFGPSEKGNLWITSARNFWLRLFPNKLTKVTK